MKASCEHISERNYKGEKHIAQWSVYLKLLTNPPNTEILRNCKYSIEIFTARVTYIIFIYL